MKGEIIEKIHMVMNTLYEKKYYKGRNSQASFINKYLAFD